MHLVVVSHKQCWKNEQGIWLSTGGFPLQMNAIASLFARVTLLVTQGKPQAGGVALPAQAEIVGLRLPKGKNFRRKVDVLLLLPYYLWKIGAAVLKADVVHTPAPGDMALLGILCAWLFKKNLIVRYGGSWVENAKNSRGNDLTRAIMRRMARRQVMLVGGSGTEPPGRDIHWLFSTAISEADLARIQPRKEKINPPVRIAYVGRLSEEKGVDVLLYSIRYIRDCQDAYFSELWIIGDGPDRKKLEDLASFLNISDVVKFKGHVDRDELTRLLSQVDFCVQPSYTEGFCKAWLDAFLVGQPVIATQVGSAEMVMGNSGERGWLVQAGDPIELATCILRVMREERDWIALRQRCRSFAEQFTLEKWAKLIAEYCVQKWNLQYEEGKLTK